MRLAVFTACLCLMHFCAAGCSRIPQPVTYDFSEQQKMQAAHHWDVLANDVASQIHQVLLNQDSLYVPVYVRATCGTENTPCASGETTQFNEGFRDLLITRLVNYNVPTCADEDRDAIVVNYKVQGVYHRDNRRAARPPGILTALTAAVSVLRDAPGEVQAIAAAAFLDVVNSATDDAEHYEIIITTSMISGNKYLFRTSDIYYINDLDFWHYQKKAGAKAIQISSH